MTDTWLDESAEYVGDDDSGAWYGDEAGEDVDFGDGDLFDEAGEDVEFGDGDLFGEARVRDHRSGRSASATQSLARRRAAAARRRRELEMRRRAQVMRTRGRTPARPVSTKTAIRNTRAAVRHEHLANRVRADAFGGAVNGLRQRSTGLERTTSAAAVTNTLKNELDNFENDLGEELTNVLRTVVDFVPLAFLKSPAKGLHNPPVVAGLAGLGIAIAGFIIRRVQTDNGVVVDSDGSAALTASRAGQQTRK